VSSSAADTSHTDARTPARLAGAVWQHHRANRYRLVFYSLLLTLVIAPLFSLLGIGHLWMAPLLALSVFSAVFGALRGRRREKLLMALAGLLLFIASLPESLTGIWLNVSAIGGCMLFAILAIVVSVRYALRPGEVGTEQVYASLSGYLLAGIVFAVLYFAVDRFVPGSLGPAGATPAAPVELNEMIYFSFVTLATLGYGDIVPHSDLARGLAVLEAITGQLYIAVLVATLISSYTASRGRPGQP
jgi:hypothetical protein